MSATMMALPAICERALLERFLRAEAMALWAVRAAQTQQLPRHVQTFLQRHETDEQDHLRQFEGMLGILSQRPSTLPTVPSQWEMLAVLLFGYEALGLEFATLLAAMRPDLSDILEDEEVHVGFFEKELKAILAGGETGAQQAREAARTWWKKLPRTVDRYLQDPTLEPYRSGLRRHILESSDSGSPTWAYSPTPRFRWHTEDPRSHRRCRMGKRTTLHASCSHLFLKLQGPVDRRQYLILVQAVVEGLSLPVKTIGARNRERV